MVAVKKINPKLSNIQVPAYLTELKGWLLWRFEGDKRKVPYYVGGGRRSGKQGEVEDRSQLTTFDEAIAAAARDGFDGVGLAMMSDYNLIALDFDKCVDANGLIDEEVERLCAGTYAEYSPSGRGIRAFVRGAVKDRKYNKSDKLNVEFFCEKGFVTVTGNAIEQTVMLDDLNTITEINADTLTLYDAYFAEQPDPFKDLTTEGTKLGATLEHAIEALGHIDPDLDYERWYLIAMGLKHEFGDTAFDLFDQWSASSKNNKYPGRAALWSKWQSFKRTKGKQVTFRNVLAAANQGGAKIYIPKVASIEDFDVLVDTPTQKDQPGRFPLIQAAAFTQRKSVEWIIKDLLPKSELAVIFGEPGSGKSFFASDLGLAIAQGGDWRGRKVKQGSVVYVAAEGAGGFSKRLKAYAHKNQIDLASLDFYVVDGAPNLMKQEDAVEITQSIQSVCEPSVIMIDTLAQSTPGANENSGEDMGLALAHCKAIHKKTGALVVLVHHSGKDASRGARGWSGLRGAVDTEIEVGRLQVGRYAKIKKQKDGEDGQTFGFDLEVVPVGLDEDNEIINSCVVIETLGDVKLDKQPTFGKWAQMLIDEAKLQLKACTQVTSDDLINAVFDTLEPHEGEGRDHRRRNIKRAMDRLELDANASIGIKDGFVTWLGPQDDLEDASPAS